MMEKTLTILSVGISVFASMILPSYAQYGGPNIPSEMINDSHSYMPPLWQLKLGTQPNDVICNLGFELLTKHDGSSACVKPESVLHLIERGWAKNTDDSTDNTNTASHYTKDVNPTDIPSANNQFALRFYSQISQTDKKSNIFFSPWSLSTAFAMAYEGARGNTAQEIQNVFGFIEDDKQRRAGFQNIMEKSNEKNSEYKFNIANALWLAQEFKPHTQYVSAIKTHYDREVNTVDFTADATGTINDWVSDKTEEKIKELFAPGSLVPDTRLVITNAIYFNGSWAFPFDEKNTRQDEFIVSSTDDKTVEVQMMHQTAFFNYYENELLQLVEMSYLGDKMSMLILLPTDINGINSLADSLTTENISKWKKQLDKKKITVEIPKFSLDTNYELIKILEEMGIHDAFGSADFSGKLCAGDKFCQISLIPHLI